MSPLSLALVVPKPAVLPPKPVTLLFRGVSWSIRSLLLFHSRDSRPPRTFGRACRCGGNEARTALLRVRHAPDEIGSIVGHGQRSVAHHEQSDGTSPHLAARIGNPSRDEVVVAAAGTSVAERHAHDFVSRQHRAIP